MNEATERSGAASGEAGWDAKARSQSWLLLSAGALICAVALLMGRWSPARLLDYQPWEQVPWYLDLRLPLIVGGLVIIAALNDSRRLTNNAPQEISTPVYFIALVLLTLTFASGIAGINCVTDYCAGKLIDIPILAGFVLVTYFMALHPGFETHFYRFVFILCMVLAVLGLQSALATISAGSQGLSVLEGGRNVYSRLLGVLAILAMFYYLKSPQVVHKIFFVGVFSLALVLLVLTGSRGGTAASLLGLIVAAIVFRAPIRGVVGVACGLAIVVTMAISAGFMDTFGQYVTDRYIDRVFGNFYSSGRDVIFADALAIWKDYPFFGVGFGRFSQLNSIMAPYAHNFFLELLSETGIVGLLLLIAPIAFLLKFICTNWPRVDKRGVAICAMYLAASQLSGDLYDSRALILITIITACGATTRLGEPK